MPFSNQGDGFSTTIAYADGFADDLDVAFLIDVLLLIGGIYFDPAPPASLEVRFCYAAGPMVPQKIRSSLLKSSATPLEVTLTLVSY